MSNWCSTKIEFVGSPDDINDLHEKLKLYTSKIYSPSDFGKNWLGNILYGFGLGDRIDSEDHTTHIRCRGTLIDISEIIDDKNDSSKKTFSIDTETAWVPMIRMWTVILTEHYGNRINLFWIAQEDGNEVYETNCLNRYPDDYYHLTWWIESENDAICDGMYSGDADDVVSKVNDLINSHNIKAAPVTVEELTATDETNNATWTLSFDEENEDREIDIHCFILRELSNADCE